MREPRPFKVDLKPGHFTGMEWGERGAQPVVMLHGFNQTCHSWEETAGEIGDDFHVIAFDQRGHGNSLRSTEGDYSRKSMAADVGLVADQFEFDTFVLIGMSMGAANSIEFTSSNGARVKQLVLVDYAPTVETAGVDKIKMLFMHRWDSIDRAVRDVRMFNPRRSEANIRSRLEHTLMQHEDGKWTWKVDPAFATQARFSEGPEVLWERVRRVTCPTLAIRGGESDVLALENAERLINELADGRLEIVAGAGHSVAGDNPEGFLTALRPFLAG